MKVKLVLLIMIGWVGLSAQSWCPPGANWYYPVDCFEGAIGYTHYTYGSDTVLLNRPCKKITSFTRQVYTGSMSVDTSYGYYITYESGDTVYSLRGSSFVPYLYFNARVGDTILVPNQGTMMHGVVDSNGKVQIAGDSLRYYYFHLIDSCYSYPLNHDHVIERIGDISNDFFPGWLSNCITEDFCIPYFSCYSDSSISYSADSTQPCYDLTLNVMPITDPVHLQIVPNPASGFVKLNYNIPPGQNGPANLQITNLLGQIVYVSPLLAGSTCQVDISGFAAGVYLVTIKVQGKSGEVVKLQVY